MAIEIQPSSFRGRTRLCACPRESHPSHFSACSTSLACGSDRAARRWPPPIVVCNEEHRFHQRRALHESGSARRGRLILSPRRNTAPRSPSRRSKRARRRRPVMLCAGDHLIAAARVPGRVSAAPPEHAAKGTS